MAIINPNIDAETKSRLEEIAKQKGFSSINDLIMKNIQDELAQSSDLLFSNAEIERFEKALEKDEIASHLRKISSSLKTISNRDEKIEKLIKFNDFLEKNKELIKEKYSDLVVSILNSL